MPDLIHFFFLILASLGVIILIVTKNIVHAAYALCLSLIALAGIYVLLGAELLAVVQIMLYAGGVVILLAFGVMMTSRLRGERVLSESRGVIPGAIISLVVFALLINVFSQIPFGGNLINSQSKQDQIQTIGISFLTEHLLAFELIAFILLVALVGASYLAKSAADE